MPEVVHWNPRLRLKETGPLQRVPRVKRVNNFGDLIGPWIVERIRSALNIGRSISSEQRLLTVGSIIPLCSQDDDIVWGSGIHGNYLPLTDVQRFDVRAVRGPLTAALLRDMGNEVPEVYGDPALLIPHLWNDSELGVRRMSGGTVIVPNYHDVPGAPPNALDPRGNLLERIRKIASANRVIASSLHGIVIAEAYGVPAVLVASSRERPFKYEDYYTGTGRQLPAVARDWRSALDTAAASPIDNWDSEALLNAFPVELWSR